MNSYLYII